MAAIDPSYQLLACQYLRKQLDALIKEVRGVRENQDIEPVHQTLQLQPTSQSKSAQICAKSASGRHLLTRKCKLDLDDFARGGEYACP